MKKTVVIVTLFLCITGVAVLLFKTDRSTPTQNSAVQKTVPAILDEKFQRPDDLTDTEKSKIDDLFEKSDIIAIGTLEMEAASPFRRLMHVEKIFKLSPQSEKYRNNTLNKPISMMAFSAYGEYPDYFQKNNHGKRFLFYGSFNISEKHPNGASLAYAAYIVAEAKNIEKAQADIVFLGKRNLSSRGSSEHRTATFDVVKTIDNQTGLPPVTIRYSYMRDTPYLLVPVNISDVEKLYWIAANKIPETDHYDGEVIGADLSADIAYLRLKSISKNSINAPQKTYQLLHQKSSGTTAY